MSSHRTAVIALANAIVARSRDILSDDAVQRLVDRGVSEACVTAFAVEQELRPELAALKHAAEELIQRAAIAEFRSAEVVLRLEPGERVARCPVGERVMSRHLVVTRVHVTSSVRTRWVHPRPEMTFSRQWVSPELPGT